MGTSAKQRHHVRLWQAPHEFEVEGRPAWIGAAIFDTGVGVSHRTAQSRIASPRMWMRNLDTLTDDVKGTKQILKMYQVTGIGPILRGRNGGGDTYFSDGEMTIALLTAGNETTDNPAEYLPNPPAVALKNRVWSWLRARLR